MMAASKGILVGFAVARIHLETRSYSLPNLNLPQNHSHPPASVSPVPRLDQAQQIDAFASPIITIPDRSLPLKARDSFLPERGVTLGHLRSCFSCMKQFLSNETYQP